MNGNTPDGIIRVRPFTVGPTFEIDTGDRPRVIMVTATSPYRDEDVRTVIFEDGPYRRGLSAASHDDVAALEIVGFATAYADRQDEFARPDDAPEQVHRAVWQRYGDALEAELSSMISERDAARPDLATRIATNRSVTPAREDKPMTEHEAVAILRDTYAIDATDANLDRLVDIGRVVGCNMPRGGATFTRGDALNATITLLRADGARRARS